MNKLDIKVYGVHQRDFLIKPFKEKLNLSDKDIIYDDRPNGGKVLYTFEKAFTQPFGDITHRLCFPDDMIVCDNFINIINRVINAQGDKIIYLFPWNMRERERLFINDLTPYKEHSRTICGNGIILPKQFIIDFFNWVHNKYSLDDYEKTTEEIVLMKWARLNNIKVITTVPSLVQHIGDDYGTTLPQYNPNGIIRKTQFFQQIVDESINWDSKDYVPCINTKEGLRYRSTKLILERRSNNARNK